MYFFPLPHGHGSFLPIFSPQQIIRKNTEAWHSFFALLKTWKTEKGKPKGRRSIKKRPRPPGYWKERQRKKRVLRILVRNDCYQLDKWILKLPLKLQVRWTGYNKWSGKQGRLEIIFNELNRKWYAFMPVEVSEEQLHQPIDNKKAYVDLGVKVPIMAHLGGTNEVIGYSGSNLLADWWYWNYRLATHVSELKKTNGKDTSKQLRRLYQKRKQRFQQAINAMVSHFIHHCWVSGASELIYGDLKNIRDNSRFSRKSNSLIHNFWSHGYLMRRLHDKAEEYGITVELINERGTSSRCPRCHSTRIIRRGRLFRCKICHLSAHRDAVGLINIGLALESVTLPTEVINRAVTRPSLVNVLI